MAVNEDPRLPCMGARFHAACRAPLENDAFTSHFLAARSIIPPYPGKAISSILACYILSEDSEPSEYYAWKTTGPAHAGA
jgi:hypothetical protein